MRGLPDMREQLYMEVRGSMTRFEPLTKDTLRTLGPKGPAYSELKDALAVHGLSIERVVCDPTRKFSNAFYADAAQGLYIDLYLGQKNLCEMLGKMHIEEQRIKASQALASGKWKRYYQNFVPVPMLI